VRFPSAVGITGRMFKTCGIYHNNGETKDLDTSRTSKPKFLTEIMMMANKQKPLFNMFKGGQKADDLKSKDHNGE
jgi:hypothetical protein